MTQSSRTTAIYGVSNIIPGFSVVSMFWGEGNLGTFWYFKYAISNSQWKSSMTLAWLGNAWRSLATCDYRAQSVDATFEGFLSHRGTPSHHPFPGTFHHFCHPFLGPFMETAIEPSKFPPEIHTACPFAPTSSGWNPWSLPPPRPFPRGLKFSAPVNQWMKTYS